MQDKFFFEVDDRSHRGPKIETVDLPVQKRKTLVQETTVNAFGT